MQPDNPFIYNHFKKPKEIRIRYNLKQIIKTQLKLKYLIFTIICEGYLVAIYILFSFYYPFVSNNISHNPFSFRYQSLKFQSGGPHARQFRRSLLLWLFIIYIIYICAKPLIRV